MKTTNNLAGAASREAQANRGGFPTRRRRPTINITPAERVGRVLLGLAAMVVGAVLLGATAGALGAVLEVLLIAAGLDLVVTGALGHCPLYAKLGHVPVSLRESP